MKPTGLQAMISSKMFGAQKPTAKKKKKPVVKKPMAPVAPTMPPKGIAVGNPNLMQAR